MSQSIAKLSSDAAILISAISRKEPGDVITWKWMSDLIGRNLQENRSIMRTIKNRMLIDYGMVLSSRPGVGYEVCDDLDVVDGELVSDRQRRRKAAKRSKLKAQTVDMTKLDESQRMRCLCEIAAAHVVVESSSDKSQKKIAETLGGATKPLALNQALIALLNGNKK